jgi:copper(I)-binding protein
LPAAAIAGKGAGPACQPVVERGWVRMAPGMPMAAGFAVLRNPCRAEAAIVGASSPAFADVSLHETRVEGGVSRMRAVPRIALPAGGTVELRPGGLHAMLMAPRADATPKSVRIEFVLADGRRVAADLPVRATAP